MLYSLDDDAREGVMSCFPEDDFRKGVMSCFGEDDLREGVMSCFPKDYPREAVISCFPKDDLREGVMPFFQRMAFERLSSNVTYEHFSRKLKRHNHKDTIIKHMF